MDIKSSIRQSIRRRKDGILLRSDLTRFGSGRQVSAALRQLCSEGSIERLDRAVYVLPSKLAALGKERLLDTIHKRQAKARIPTALINSWAGPDIAMARYVRNFAKQLDVIYKPTFADRWASAVAGLAGDAITPDETDDLFVALTRNGTISPGEMVKLVMDHHRALMLKI